jgi:hypothetical protein
MKVEGHKNDFFLLEERHVLSQNYISVDVEEDMGLELCGQNQTLPMEVRL